VDPGSTGDRAVGPDVDDCVGAYDLDLLVMGALVMGACGHFRPRDFILGGATKTVISTPSLPVLLPH